MVDKFYTNDDIAKKCIGVLSKKIDINKYDYHLEPSAGMGSLCHSFFKKKYQYLFILNLFCLTFKIVSIMAIFEFNIISFN